MVVAECMIKGTRKLFHIYSTNVCFGLIKLHPKQHKRTHYPCRRPAACTPVR